MIRHYLTLAFRNLWKYRTQNAVSIVGLAVGFTCFALATLWIHYEMTYDSWREGAERTYLLYQQNNISQQGYEVMMTTFVGETLTQAFPEIESTCYVINNTSILKANGQEVAIPYMGGDSTSYRMFGTPGMLLAGNTAFLYRTDQIALTETVAKRLFGSTDVLGKEVDANFGYYRGKRTVCALLKDTDPHSNITWGCWAYIKPSEKMDKETFIYMPFNTYIRLRPGCDFKAFCRKLNAYKGEVRNGSISYTKDFKDYRLVSLKQFHYSPVNLQTKLKFQYLILFAIACGMIILCALFNYLSLFALRIYTRLREVELRQVCGSSLRGLLALFGTEYLLVLLFAGLIGMTLIEWVLPEFRQLSGVEGSLYAESLLYFIGVVVVSFLFLLPLVVRSPRPKLAAGRQRPARLSIFFQLTVCMLFVFVISVILCQLNLLKEGDAGFDRKHTAVINYFPSEEAYEAMFTGIQQSTHIDTVIKDPLSVLFPHGSYSLRQYDAIDGSGKSESFLCFDINEAFLQFYHLRLLKGRLLTDKDIDKALISETGAKALGIDNPIGYTLPKDGLTIVGIVKDVHYNAPTVPVGPILFVGHENHARSSSIIDAILIKYKEKKWNALKMEVDSLIHRLNLDSPKDRPTLFQVEEEYNKLLASEDLLLRLLGIAALVCVLTAAFGIFSLVSLRCEQRRKEIAIRKVNGARVGDILALFGREHLWLLMAAAVIAFPIGYMLMKRWLQSYVQQTPIFAWLYLVIFVGAALLIALCIGWRVWQAARSNPADTIKAE